MSLTSPTAVARRPGALSRPLARDLAIALGTGLAVALAKRYLDFHLGVPGHSGLFWVAVLLAGASRGRAGTGVAAGAAVGLWGIPAGLGHSAGYNMALYASAGAALDAMRLARWMPVERLAGAVVAGTAMHLAKLAFIVMYASATGLVKHIHLLGLAPTAFNHVLFGAGAGVLAWAALRASKARRSPR
jgi:hypothetical protein